MSLPLVYLAGPITGQSFAGATDWRQYATDKLKPVAIGLSPMRRKDYLIRETSIADEYTESVLSSQRGITTRDRWDAMRCDVLLANLAEADRVSIGTVMEIAWADSRRIPIVLVMEEGNPHDHAMLREVAGFRVSTLDDALDTIRALLAN